jgi:hypothetical protein
LRDRRNASRGRDRSLSLLALEVSFRGKHRHYRQKNIRQTQSAAQYNSLDNGAYFSVYALKLHNQYGFRYHYLWCCRSHRERDHLSCFPLRSVGGEDGRMLFRNGDYGEMGRLFVEGDQFG